MNWKLLRIASMSLLFAFMVQSCKKDEPIPESKTTDQYSHETATAWFAELRILTKKTPGFTPPVAARAFGYAGVALWESVVPGVKNGKSLAGQVSALANLPTVETGKIYHWPTAANAAMAEISRKLYPTTPAAQLAQIDSLENVLSVKAAAEIDGETFDRSTTFGKQIAAAVFEWSKTDGGHEGYKSNFPASYVVPTGPGFWVPTSPTNLIPLQPFWGENRAFVPNITSISQPKPPITYSESKTSLFYSQALEVYSVTSNLTTEQKTIAKFWSDDPGNPGTPPGHSISIASIVLVKENANLEVAAETFARLGIAVNDAFVSCWKCKYVHNLVRPVTYLQAQIDPAWTTLLSTPPFPEYTSGHSVQSGASAQVLSNLFGYNYHFTDNTHAARTDIDGSPRNFNSFYDFADEAALSRLYGGIHYRDAIEVGANQGVLIGEAVNGLKFR